MILLNIAYLLAVLLIGGAIWFGLVLFAALIIVRHGRIERDRIMGRGNGKA